ARAGYKRQLQGSDSSDILPAPVDNRTKMYHWLYDHFGWPGLFGVSLLPRCAHSVAHCTTDPPRHRASTVPRTIRSRWLLIRSSSIVMTLFSGLGVSSDMAAPSCWPGCV